MYENDLLSPGAARDLLRFKIKENVADNISLLGTTSDAVLVLLYQLSKFCASLNTAQSLAEVRTAAQPMNDSLGSFFAKVDAGTVKLTYQAKGIDKVIKEIEDRATAVTEVLESAS